MCMSVMVPVTVVPPCEQTGHAIGLHEADEDVRPGQAELDEERRLVGLDPGVDDLGALDGGGLDPGALPAPVPAASR